MNDTIWFELNTPTQLKDLMTNAIIDYSNAVNFGPSIQYLAFTGGDIFNPGGMHAANSFDNVLISGIEVPGDMPDKVRGYRCIEANGQLYFQSRGGA